METHLVKSSDLTKGELQAAAKNKANSLVGPDVILFVKNGRRMHRYYRHPSYERSAPINKIVINDLLAGTSLRY